MTEKAKIIYEIVNPSDMITFECDDDDVAAISVLVLSRGKYGCRRTDKGEMDSLQAFAKQTVLPILAFGGFEPWLNEFVGRVGCTLNVWINANRLRMAEALESTYCMSPEERMALKLSSGNDPKALERWSETKRTSLNNICKAARAWASAAREDQ